MSKGPAPKGLPPQAKPNTGPKSPVTRVTREIYPTDTAPDNTSPRVTRDLIPTQTPPGPNPTTRVKREIYDTAS